MSQTPIAPTNIWRTTDLEAIRVALSIPAQMPAVRAINDAMADLEQTYPDAMASAKARRISSGAEVIAFDTELLRQKLTLHD